MHTYEIDGIPVGGKNPFVLIAGPCAIEDEKMCHDIAGSLKEICASLSIPYIFKASYDKANRSSITSPRGPGIGEGLRILSAVRKKQRVPVLTDVHDEAQAAQAAAVVDMIQIPAFLCRQTDLIVAAARTGKPVNVKKGQFLAPWDVRNIIAKMTAAGNRKIMMTERGASFGYNNLVVDFKALPIMRGFGYPVCFDATHSVQLPGGAGTSSGGQREYVEYLLRASLAVGVDAIFIETHPRPDEGLSDSTNMLPLHDLERILTYAKQLDSLVKSTIDF